MYDTILKQLERRQKPLDVILVGMGFMGFGFLSYTKSIRGIRVPLVISRRVNDASKLLQKQGFNVAIQNNSGKIKNYADKGYVSVSDDLSLIRKFENAIVFEATGSVSYGAEVAVETIKAGKHLVTMNPELQATIGTKLKELADAKNVIITDVVGDQPGSIANLIAKARLMGFKVRMAGNMKRYLDVHATQEKMAPWAKDKGLAVRQTTSFTDGTKQSIEMNLVGNYFGMGVLKRGMVGPEVSDVKEVLEKFEWNKIPQNGVVDYVIGKKLFPGVFLVAEHKDPHQKKYLKYLGLGEGPRYVLFEPYHLCHLEVVQTIAKVALFGEPTINNSTNPILTTIATAKKNLSKGERIDGIGGDTVYGLIDSIKDASDFLPIGLSHDAIVKNDIPKDAPIKTSDVILPLNSATLLSGLAKSHQKSSFLGFLFRSINLF